MKGCGAEPTDVQCGTSRNTHGLANAFFRSEGDASKALRMDKADMEGRYIELSMDHVPVTFSDEAHNPCTLRMNGVPYKTSSQVIHNISQMKKVDLVPHGLAKAGGLDFSSIFIKMSSNKK